MEPQIALRLSVDRRKPPLSHLHCQRSSVINLDKNRIRHAKRLLPRPLSLPSGFNLMRQLGISTVSEKAEEISATTIDLAEIKQLEDDIYNRKKVSSLSSADRRKICQLGADCSNCNSDGRPVSIDQCRMKAASQAIMLLDAWQMNPLLSKYTKSPLLSCHSANELIISKTSNISNSSNFEFKPQPLHMSQFTTSEQPKTIPDPPSQLLSIDVKRRSTKPSSTGRSKSVFQRCISSDTTTDEEGDIQMINKSDLLGQQQNAYSEKVSKFKRFIMHRRSLNLSRHNNSALTTNNQSGHDRLPIVVCPEPAINEPPIQNDTQPITVPSHTYALLQRRWRSDDEIYETVDRRSNAVKRASRVSGRQEEICAKLIDLERMQEQLDQLSVDLAKRRQMLLVGSDSSDNNLITYATKRQRSPSMLLLFQSNQKRHSIGSPTDLVKTWEYRRR